MFRSLAGIEQTTFWVKGARMWRGEAEGRVPARGGPSSDRKREGGKDE